MQSQTALPAHRFVAQRLKEAGFAHDRAKVSKTESGMLMVTLKCKVSKAFTWFAPVQLSPAKEYLFVSREQVVAKGIQPERFVVPSAQPANMLSDSVFPLMRLSGAVGARPWMYFTYIEGNFVCVVVKGKQDVTDALDQHLFTNWNGVFFRRSYSGIRPSDFGVVPVDKAQWRTFCLKLGMSDGQIKVVFNKTTKPITHGHPPCAEALYNALVDLTTRDNTGAPVTQELVSAVMAYAATQLCIMPTHRRLALQAEMEDSVTEALEGLQELILACGLATPLQGAAIEQWIYARVPRPHVMRVFLKSPHGFSWEGPSAADPKDVRGTYRVEVELEGHEVFRHGVVSDIRVPAMTGVGCDFLVNNLEEMARSHFKLATPIAANRPSARKPLSLKQAPASHEHRDPKVATSRYFQAETCTTDLEAQPTSPELCGAAANDAALLSRRVPSRVAAR